MSVASGATKGSASLNELVPNKVPPCSALSQSRELDT